MAHNCGEISEQVAGLLFEPVIFLATKNNIFLKTFCTDTSVRQLWIHLLFVSLGMWSSNCQYFFLDRYKALPFLPLNSHPGSECGTEGLNVSAKCLVQLVFTRKDKMKT